MKCNICLNSTKVIFTSNMDLSVSSDAKIVNSGIILYQCTSCNHILKKQYDQIDTIYDEYKSNDLIEGLDQIKFIQDIPTFRTDVILEKIISKIKDKNNLLDVGTGTGVFLQSCNKYTDLDLSAFDLNDSYKKNILDIQNVNNFYTNNISDIKENFDIISLIHVIEHIQDPIKFLNILKSKLTINGFLLVQVPYILKNKNDALVYDHLSHFTKNTISFMLKKVFKYIYFIETGIENELTVIATNHEMSFSHNIIKDVQVDLDFTFINKVNTYLNQVEEPIFIFGTAPISTYFAAVLQKSDKLEGFLDEDKLKIGKNHLNKKIFHPNNVNQIKCFIPLNKNIVNKVNQLYNEIEFISIQEVLKNGKL